MIAGGERLEVKPGTPQEMEQLLERVYHLLEIRKRILRQVDQAMDAAPSPEEGEQALPQLPPPEEAAEPQRSEAPPPTQPDPSPQNKPKERRRWGDVLFYLVLLAIVVGALMWKESTTTVRTFAGFSAFTVLSGSMETEIPKGSLIITRQVDPDTLQVGDDITYMRDATTTITHRIVEIVEDYQQTGQRAFRTQGVMNAEPDKQLVPAVNVVGKVVFHSHLAGQVVGVVSRYWHLAVLFLLLFGGLYAALRTWVWKDGVGREKTV